MFLFFLGEGFEGLRVGFQGRHWSMRGEGVVRQLLRVLHAWWWWWWWREEVRPEGSASDAALVEEERDRRVMSVMRALVVWGRCIGWWST